MRLASSLLAASLLLSPALARASFAQGAGAAAHPAAAPRVDKLARTAALQRALDELRARHGFPGATFAASLPDGTLLEVATGLADQEAQTPMRPRDRMLAGSVGKTFIGAVALQLVGEGKLALDEKVSKVLGTEPWFAKLPNAEQLTLAMLLRHTSGLPDHVWDPDFQKALEREPERAWTPRELVAFVCGDKPLFEAGHGWAYADTNYVVVGLAIEAVTGHSPFVEARRRLLEPLKLADTLPQDQRVLPGLIAGYCGDGNPFGMPRKACEAGRHRLNPQMEDCGGGFLSCAPDLARWARALWGGEAVPASQRGALIEAVEADAARLGAGAHYGIATIVVHDELGEQRGHSGWFPGYRTEIGYYPERELAFALQINCDEPAKVRRGFAPELVRAALGIEKATAAEPR